MRIPTPLFCVLGAAWLTGCATTGQRGSAMGFQGIAINAEGSDLREGALVLQLSAGFVVQNPLPTAIPLPMSRLARGSRVS